MIEIIIAAVVAIVVGFAIGYFLMQKVLKDRNDATANEAKLALADAKREAENLKKEAIVEAKDDALKIKQDAERESKERMRGTLRGKPSQPARAKPRQAHRGP